MTNNDTEFKEKVVKRQYVKPTIEVIELRSEERMAGSNKNCHAERGAKNCPPAANPGGGQ